jgi:hypothetical protein
MREIVELAEHKIEHFILRCVYTILVAYIQCDQRLDMPNAIGLSHDEVRGCLFDLNLNKTDVLYSLDPPRLCSSCKERVSERQLDADFLSRLDSEMGRIRKGLFYRASGWVKIHPLIALLITATFALILNLASNALYDFAKYDWHGKPQHQAQEQGSRH